jgi:hypothetical protein
MSIRPWIAGAFAALAAVSAPSAISPLQPLWLRAATTPGTAALRAYGSRGPAGIQTAASARLDGALADIVRHQSLVHAGTELSDLHSLHPAVRFRASSAGTPEVLVDAVTLGDPQALESALVALGLEHPAVFSNDVSGWLPVAQLETAAARAEVHALRAAMFRHRAAVATQGDYAQQSAALRIAYPTLTGAGVTVGVLSDSFDCFAIYGESGSGVPKTGPTGYAFGNFAPTTAAQDEASGALPAAGVSVLEEVEGGGTNGCVDTYGAPYLTPYTDEGRAMLQIVHAVAPGASLAFYTADNGEAEFALGIEQLQAAGATVEADDAGYFDEPFFQDGIVAQAVDTVQAAGVAYFSAAGNDAEFAYENTAPAFVTQSTSGANSGEFLLNFDTSNATNTTALPVTIPMLVPGEFVAVVVEWDQPYVTGAKNSGGATSQIDLCTNVSGNDLITNPLSDFGTATTCTGPNSLGSDPYQVLIVGNPATNSNNSTAQALNIIVGLAGGTPAPGRVKVAVLGDGVNGLSINAFATNSPTIQGHPNATGAAAVGAAFYFDTPACGTTPATLEVFSSAGGDPILFDVNGNRLATPVVRQKPNFVGPDGVNDTFLGATLEQYGLPSNTLNTATSQCQTNATYPSFFGTSAATPHAAGIAALMLQANPAATPAEIFSALQSGALPMSGTSPNYNSGYGFIQATNALAALPPGAPSLSLSSSSINVGQSATLAWSSINTTGCTASGSWSGAQATSGTLSLTPTAAGTSTYTLVCANAVGTSSASSATLTVSVLQPPAAPTLTLSSSSITLGSSITLTWSSTNATSCTASGSWSGSEPTSGSTTVTPSTAGSDSYTLTCSNAAGSSTATTDVVTVTAASSRHGGGGLDLTTLLALAAVLGWRWRFSAAAFRSPRPDR